MPRELRIHVDVAAIRDVANLHPDVILLDVSIPVLNGLEVARIVRRDHPEVAVVMMSEQDASGIVASGKCCGDGAFRRQFSTWR